MNPEKLIPLCRFLNEHHINGPQLSVLALIPQQTAAQISKTVGENPANIYAGFKALEKKKFITLHKNPENKRESLAELTDSGKGIMNELAASIFQLK